MHRRGAALAALLFTATTASAVATATAQAAPTVVDVRVEGRATTLFDRAVLTDGHTIRAQSDTVSRPCDGTNLAANATPGPTPTAATVDALASRGLGFDGLWYDTYQDYFIQQWGPDREDAATYAYWGILVNDVLTPVGGCQWRLTAGDQVLWAYDAFTGKPFLHLAGPASATVDAPVAYTVTAGDGSGPGATPRSGATVRGVDADGADVAGSATAGTSDPTGRATVTFSQTGWQRLKARQAGAISSNSVDVCVVAQPGDTCAGLPPSRQPVAAPTDPHAGDPPVYTGSGGVPAGATSGSVAPPAASPELAPTPAPAPTAAPAVRLAGAPVVAGRRATLSWTVVSPGAGVAGWTVAVRERGTRRAFAVRARGTTETSTSLRLGAGRAYDVRLTITDRDGRVSAPADSTAVIPTTAGLRRAGRWTGSVGRCGAQAMVRLRAGRPAFVLRGPAPGARVAIRAGGRSRVVRVGALRRGSDKLVAGRARTSAGKVTLRVRSGRVRLAGAVVLR